MRLCVYSHDDNGLEDEAEAKRLLQLCRETMHVEVYRNLIVLRRVLAIFTQCLDHVGAEKLLAHVLRCDDGRLGATNSARLVIGLLAVRLDISSLRRRSTRERVHDLQEMIVVRAEELSYLLADSLGVRIVEEDLGCFIQLGHQLLGVYKDNGLVRERELRLQ